MTKQYGISIDGGPAEKFGESLGPAVRAVKRQRASGVNAELMTRLEVLSQTDWEPVDDSTVRVVR